MKKVFEIIGLISLVLFSFYYTNEIVELNKEKDPIMVSISEYAKSNNTKCIEGYITEEGVVLGISGLEVDEELSYSNMKGIGFNKDLMVFKENSCVVTRENNINNYIIRSNENKNSVSFLINIKNFNYLEQIINISENKKIKLGIITDGITLENNKKYLNILYNSGYDILYNGRNKNDLKKFLNIIKSFDSKYKPFCVYTDYDILDLCIKYDLNSIKTNYIFDKDILKNTKDTLDKGNIIILNENKNVVNELSVTINFIKSKGIKVLKIIDHLK